jgi:hypothetical protein
VNLWVLAGRFIRWTAFLARIAAVLNFGILKN